jgi:MFS family permease
VTPALSSGERALVGSLALTEIVSWGILYYAFGVMVTPMQAELGWSQGLLGGGFSLALFVSALLAVPVGRWLERHGPRALMTVGSCAGAGLVYAWSYVESPLGFYLLCVAFGFPLASTLYEAAFAAVVLRIESGRRRELALLFLTVVAGLASTVFVPLTQWLEAARGWRAALRCLALLLAVVTIPLHALVLGRRPGSRAEASVGPEVPSALSRRRLTLTSAAFALATIAGTALGVYLVPMLIEQGFTASFAATATGMIGIGQVVGRVGFTWLRPRHSLALWSWVLFVPAALGLAILAAGPPRALVWPAVLLFALSSGAQTLGRTAWALELLDLRSFARVNGVLGLWSLLGRAGAPLALGLAHDLSGSHAPGLVALVVLCVLGSLCARAALRD